MSRSVAERYLAETREILDQLNPGEICAFTDVLLEAWTAGSTIYVCGNGGSASTAQHLAADLFKCTIVPGKSRVRVMSLNDNMSLISALTNDEGWNEVYVQQLITWWRPGDVVLGISVHGGQGQDQAGLWSRNVVRALRYANENGGKSLGLVGFDGGTMKEICTRTLVIPAESTAHIEGLHVVIHHMITTLLRQKIGLSKDQRSQVSGS